MTGRTGEGWLLQLNNGLRAAVGLREMLYILTDEPTTHRVPQAPPHAARVIVWQQQLVPLIDLQVYLGYAGASAAKGIIGIVACVTGTDADSPATLGALLLSGPPEKIQVSDEQACRLPQQQAAWASIAASCFRHPVHGPVPILDLSAILA